MFGCSEILTQKLACVIDFNTFNVNGIKWRFREPLSIFTKYETTVTPKINILIIIMIIKMFIFGVTVVLYFEKVEGLYNVLIDIASTEG